MVLSKGLRHSIKGGTNGKRGLELLEEGVVVELDEAGIHEPLFPGSSLLLVGAFGVGSPLGNARSHSVIFEESLGLTGQMVKCRGICWGQ